MKLKILHLLILLPLTQLITQETLQAQICYDWKSQSTAYVINGSTPDDPDFYIWDQGANNKQGVHLCVLNADIIPVYIQQNNNFINFTSRIGPSSAILYMLQLEVNVNDAGYSVIYSGSPKQDIVWEASSSSFPDLGTYDLKVRITFSDGGIYDRRYEIKVIPASDKLYKDNVGNTIRKWSGNNFNGLNAIVFSEGFDAYNTNGQEMYYWAAADLIECFNNNEYDVFLLDNYFGTQSIRSNAAVFASAVDYISSQYGNELIVAGGVSMGGIISRYAMAKSEEEGNPLPVHTFIAIDSPHQGAVVSQPLQDFKKSNESDDEFAQYALNNPAAKQLLNYNAYDPEGTIHENFYQELNSLNGDGYPHFTRNIGVSFSTSQSNPNTGGWYKIKYYVGPLSGTIKTFDLTSDEMQAGSWLPKDLTSMSPIIKQASYWWIQLLAPGITPLYYPSIEFERLSDPTYISYYSALDIRNGHSLFDVVIEPENTSYHDVLPLDITEEIINEVILTKEFYQNTNVIGNWHLRGGEIFAGRYVTSLIPEGDVKVHSGGKLNMHASEQVSIRDGFYAFYGSEVHAIADPNLHYECNTSRQENINEALSIYPHKVITNKTLFNDKLKIYPNPANDQLFINMPDKIKLPATLEIFNIYSKQLMKIEINSKENTMLDISSLAKGTYIVKVSGREKSFTGKLIKL